MPKRSQAKELFTASEVARFCQVDLKTIHNWADRGEVRHFRTPGRHLRFRRADVMDFLRKYGYPIPEALKQGRPAVQVIDEDQTNLDTVRRALGVHFEVTTFGEPVDALVAIGSEAPEVIVLDPEAAKIDAVKCIERLRQGELSRHIRIVAYSTRADARQRALDAGAVAFVVKPDIDRLIETIHSVLGT
jgi:excisionase family DNA binding protein